MSKAKKTKVKDKAKEIVAESLNQDLVRAKSNLSTEESVNETKKTSDEQKGNNQSEHQSEADKEYEEKIRDAISKMFHNIEDKNFIPQDYETEIPIDSLESAVGYSSLIRQMHHAFVKRVAYYRSPAEGCLTIEEARARAFHACTNEEEAIKIFDSMMSLPLESLNFVDLMELHSYSPRTAEWFWENAKKEGRKEFESGHLAANVTFPVDYMKGLWNIARYLGVRESFIDDWSPQGGIEVALIDMMAQSYFQWQYWLEQTVKRSKTQPREEHYEYQKWKRWNEELKKAKSWETGYWFPPYVSEQQAIEHAVQMADRFNRIFMRTLRQLRDLRRYSLVTINNPNQVNIATDGGQQVNVTNPDEDTTKTIIS